MRTATFFTLLATATIAVAAAVEKRQGPIFTMYGCTGPSFAGTCGVFGLTDSCASFAGTAYYKTLNSVASTTSLYYCDIYTSDDCTGTPFVVENDVSTNQLPSPYADGVASFQCHAASS